MSALRRDLLERKLWMVVAILIAAVAAVPVFLLKGASASTTPTVPAPRAAPAGSTQTATNSRTASAEPTKVVLARIARNPFAGAVPKLSSTPASQKQLPSSTSAGSTSIATTASSSGSTSTVAMVSPSPATGSASSSGTSSSGSATSSTATASTSSTAPTSTIASTSPTVQATKPVKLQSWTTYSVSVRFGKDIRVPLKSDIARLTPLPSALEPEVMFMGVLSTGRSAVFALRQGVGHTGPGLCRPDHALCSAIVIKVGQTEHLTIPTASGGRRKRILRVVNITSSVTHSRTVALDAYERISHAGMCDLLLADPMLYNLGTGTLSNVPKSMCKDYPNAVPFSYFRTAQ